MSTINNHKEIVRIGFVTEPDLTFISCHSIFRKNVPEIINWKGEKYRKVNTEWNCYILEERYNALFHF